MDDDGGFQDNEEPPVYLDLDNDNAYFSPAVQQ
jgi:hypothetical protein